MKLTNVQVQMEYVDGSWLFVGVGSGNVKFEQAVVNATYVARDKVTGFVVSVHGVDQDLVSQFSSRTRAQIGITSTHSLGRGPTVRRVRLMADGSIENGDIKC